MDQLKVGQKEHWEERIANVIQSEDNQDIPRVHNAGKIIDQQLIMHNGIAVDPLSYYHFPMLEMLRQNKGVHEPQEEKIFQEVLQSLDRDKELVMLELGAYWSFYSLWCKTMHPKTHCYMVEPDRKNLHYGKVNFRLNQMQGQFLHGKIGKTVDRSANVLTVDHICQKYQLSFVDVLHTDIQGFEVDMLAGAKNLLSYQKVGYWFVSTHSNELHYECQKVLEEHGYQIIANIDLDASYSWDGVLVAKLPGYFGIDQVTYSKKGNK